MIDHKDLIQRNFKKVEQSIISLVTEKDKFLLLNDNEEKTDKNPGKCERLIMRFERAIEIVCNIFFRAVEMAEYGSLSNNTGACITKMKHLSLITSEELWIKMINSRSTLTTTLVAGSRMELCNQILDSYIDELNQFCERVKQRFDFS